MSKPIYQYRATQVEKYRRYINDEWTSHEEMLQSLVGGIEPNHAMEFGTAVHASIDHLQRTWQLLDHPQFKLNPDSLHHCKELLTYDAITEITATGIVAEYPDCIIELKGTADAVLGTRVIDFKTTLKSITDSKVQAYQDSMQWKCYLWLFAAKRFDFVIQHWQADDDCVHFIADEQIVTCSAYGSMQDDVRRMVIGLHEFAVQNEVHLIRSETLNFYQPSKTYSFLTQP